MFAGAVEGIKDTFASRAMTNIIDFRVTEQAENRAGELIADGEVPIVYANHQSHADGIALVVLAEYLRNLASEIPNGYPLRGLGLILASSMVSGDQSVQLTQIFDLLKSSAKKMGAELIPVTRNKDVIQYGMSRIHSFAETRLIIEKLKEGYGIGFLPEGTVEPGRHREGDSREKIKGMQEVANNNLIDIFRLAKKVVRRSREAKPFYQPFALHGSFRILECLEGGKPKLTPLGKLSLIMAALGLPCPLKIQATLLKPFTEEEIVADLGANWIDDSPTFNRYAMERIAPFVPPVARGVYGIHVDSRAIEISATS